MSVLMAPSPPMTAVKRHSACAGAQGSVVADAHYAAVNFSAAGVTVSHLQHQRSISGLGKLSAAVDRSTGEKVRSSAIADVDVGR